MSNDITKNGNLTIDDKTDPLLLDQKGGEGGSGLTAKLVSQGDDLNKVLHPHDDHDHGDEAHDHDHDQESSRKIIKDKSL